MDRIEEPTSARTGPGAPPAERAPHERLDALDIARAIAIVLMLVAHTAPSDGPARILITSEFLTAPLFALLVGAAAQVSAERATARSALRTLVRAAVLAAIGLLLAQSGAQVVIVLVPLAVLTALCIPLVRLPSAVLALVVAGGVVVTPLLAAAVRAPGASAVAAGETQGGPSALLPLLGALGGLGPYRLSAFLAYAAAGMLLMRVLHRNAPGRVLPVAVGAVCLLGVMLLLLVAPNVLGLFEVHAYDGTLAETAGDLAGAAGILLGCWWLQETVTVRLPERTRALLRAPGSMALTLYTLQILVLHLFTVLRPGEADDSWAMMIGLIVGLLGFAAAWRALLGDRDGAQGRAWRRGPVETIGDGIVGLLPR